MSVKAHNVSTQKGIKKTPPTEGSKSWKRKQNKSKHMQGGASR